MEWVEVTGKTVEAAQAAALDHLGVHESEAEFNVIEEGRAGIFGLFGQDARVRARVLPKQPRPKQERRPRKGKGGGGRGGGRGGKNNNGGNGARGEKQRSKTGSGGRDGERGGGKNQGKGRGSKPQKNDTQKRTPVKGDAAKEVTSSPTDAAPDTNDVVATPSADARGPRQRNRKGRGRNADESKTTDSTDSTASNERPSSPESTPTSRPPAGGDAQGSAPASVDAKTRDPESSTTTSTTTTSAITGGGAALAGAAAAAKAKSPSDRRTSTASRDDKQEEAMSTDEITVEQQGEIASDFLDGLLEAFGADGEIKSTMVDDDVIEVSVHGKDLGLMIGPKGATLHSIQELARTAVQRSGQGTHRGRLLLDVGGYRQHRRAALEQFAGQVAERVIAENKEHALEPMNSADRKAIHDAVNEIDGVRTISEGEDPRRRIVILPAD